MATNIELISGSGIGLNGRYRVQRDGHVVAVIEREGNHWRLVSIHYSHRLGGAKDIATIRAQAFDRASYPTEVEVYETIAGHVEHLRRKWITKARAELLAQAALDLANGSNSAQDRLIELAREIEAYAKDRSDIGNQQFAGWQLAYDGTSPNYPEPPVS